MSGLTKNMERGAGGLGGGLGWRVPRIWGRSQPLLCFLARESSHAWRGRERKRILEKEDEDEMLRKKTRRMKC